MVWAPSRIIRVVRALGSSTRPFIVETDSGQGYLKAMGNPEGPHVLACDLVGTQLAKLLKLPTFDFHILNVEDMDELEFLHGGQAHAGPALITRAELGFAWGGKEEQLELLENPQDLARLILFDTWTRNRDRYFIGPPPRLNYDNVFFSEEGAPSGKFFLKAIDHGLCFTHYSTLTPNLANINFVKEQRAYGFFPQFYRFLVDEDLNQAFRDMSQICREDIRAAINLVPSKWEVSKEIREAWAELIWQRKVYLETFFERKNSSESKILSLLEAHKQSIEMNERRQI